MVESGLFEPLDDVAPLAPLWPVKAPARYDPSTDVVVEDEKKGANRRCSRDIAATYESLGGAESPTRGVSGSGGWTE